MRIPLIATLTFIAAGCGPAAAGPLVAPAPASGKAPLVLAADGCGRGYFRTLTGECFRNRRFAGPQGTVAPPPCPPGFLRAPDRPLCYPVY